MTVCSAAVELWGVLDKIIDGALRFFNLPLNWEDQGQQLQDVIYYIEYADHYLNPIRGRDSLDFCSDFYALQHQESHQDY